MKAKNTLVLLIVFGLLFSFVYFYERHTKSTGELNEAKGRIVEVDRDKIKSITIKNPETKIELQKRDNQWFIESPVKDRADSSVVTTLFTSLETLRSTATVDGEKDQMKEFGLSEPNTKIVLTDDAGKPAEIDFGKDAAVEGKVYATVAGSNAVQVVPSDLKNQISKKTDEFRDRKLAALTTQQIKNLEIKSAAGALALAKKNNHWSIDKPLVARGDDSKINDLVSQACTAHIDQFITDENLANYGLAEPRGTIDFSIEGSDKPVVLQVGASPKEEKDKDKVYVKLSTREGITLVAKSAVEGLLNTKPNDVRDKNLVRFESDIVDRINIEPASKEKLIISRKGESWVRKEGDKDVAINESAAKRLLSELQSAVVDNFVADTAADLSKYGLDKPQVKVTLSSYASENTAETKAGEKPIVTILFGTGEGNDTYAKLDDEPFIVATSKLLVDSILTSPIQWQELGIYKFKPDEVTALEVNKPGQPPLGLERDKDKAWKLVKGEGSISSVDVQSLVGTLAKLNALRWIGPAAPDQGLDKPTLSINFTATQGDKKIPGKLTVGGPAPDDTWYTTADGVNGVFVISRPDYDALQSPLTDKAAAAKSTPPPSAAQTPTPAPTTPEPVPVPQPAPTPAAPTPAAPTPAAPAPDVPASAPTAPVPPTTAPTTSPAAPPAAADLPAPAPNAVPSPAPAAPDATPAPASTQKPDLAPSPSPAAPSAPAGAAPEATPAPANNPDAPAKSIGGQ